MPLMATTAQPFDLHNHSFLQPDPEGTITHGGVEAMPNSCNLCHTAAQKPPEWAQQTIAHARSLAPEIFVLRPRADADVTAAANADAIGGPSCTKLEVTPPFWWLRWAALSASACCLGGAGSCGDSVYLDSFAEQHRWVIDYSRLFWPGTYACWWRRLLPYGILALAAGSAFLIGGAGWEYTNSSEFCGTSCHTMPPEYLSYLASPHANVKCVECHIGRATIATQFFRKAQDISHVVQFVGADYEVPIYSKKLRPASQVCEKCHNPDKFSANSLDAIQRFDADANNALDETHLSFKIGGGTHREGLGKGIHWHIENEVEYIATDNPHLEQEIPWVRVTYADTGETDVFVDTWRRICRRTLWKRTQITSRPWTA